MKKLKEKFSNFVLNIFSNIKEKAFLELKEKIRNLETLCDEQITRMNWYVKDWRERTLWTPFGDLTISRRIYVNRHTGMYWIPFDEFIGLDPFLYIQKDFWPNILSGLEHVKSYEALSKMFGQNFSTTSISTMIKNQEFYFDVKQLATHTEVLYINVDGIYVKKHKSKKYEMKVAIAYTGTTGGKRSELINKVLLPFNDSLTISEIGLLMNEYINAIYGVVDKVYIVGDGARWIGQLENYVTNSTRYIDKFHYKKWVKDFIRKRTKIDWNNILTWSKLELKNWLYSFIGDPFTGEVKKWEHDLYKWILKYHQSFKDNTRLNLKNVSECTQSHQVASHLKNRRAFSEGVAYKILMINVAAYNDWLLTTDASKGINIKSLQNESDTMSKSILNSKETNVPLTRSNIPSTAAFFNAICHGLKR